MGKNIMMEVLLNVPFTELVKAVEKLDGEYNDNITFVLNQLANYQFKEE